MVLSQSIWQQYWSFIVGAHACGISPKMMEGIAENLDMRLYYDVSVPRLAFIKGDRVEEFIRLLIKGKI